MNGRTCIHKLPRTCRGNHLRTKVSPKLCRQYVENKNKKIEMLLAIAYSYGFG